MRPGLTCFMRTIQKFQSTHPHGVRPQTVPGLYSNFYFNPRTRMGCDISFSVGSNSFLFQSTHPHGVRQVCHRPDDPAVGISIHAPAWGATSEKYGLTVYLCDFNPRTRMGCDSSDFGILAIGRYFNPRTRMGCDESFVNMVTVDVAISIHAPAWGATV